MLPYEPVIHT